MLFAFCPATAKQWSSILIQTNLDPALSCRNLFSTIILLDSNYPVSDFGVGTATVVFRHALTKLYINIFFVSHLRVMRSERWRSPSVQPSAVHLFHMQIKLRVNSRVRLFAQMGN